MKTPWVARWLVARLLAPAVPAAADETAGSGLESGSPRSFQEDLAKKLANPISDLISLPLQYNYDRGYGKDDDGSIHRLNIQPVIPFSLNDGWNVITRTIVPLIDQNDIPRRGDDEFGLGDILASQFLSPREPTARGWIWGAGPVWLLPTATDEKLGGEKWGVGPTAVALRQEGPWTYGALANHIWSFAGDDDRKDVNATFLQPFVAYVTETKTTIGMNTECTFDWKEDEWSVPMNLMVSQLLKVGNLPLSLQVGARYWVHAPDRGPEGWGLRLSLTFLFPK